MVLFLSAVSDKTSSPGKTKTKRPALLPSSPDRRKDRTKRAVRDATAAPLRKRVLHRTCPAPIPLCSPPCRGRAAVPAPGPRWSECRLRKSPAAAEASRDPPARRSSSLPAAELSPPLYPRACPRRRRRARGTRCSSGRVAAGSPPCRHAMLMSGREVKRSGSRDGEGCVLGPLVGDHVKGAVRGIVYSAAAGEVHHDTLPSRKRIYLLLISIGGRCDYFDSSAHMLCNLSKDISPSQNTYDVTITWLAPL